MIGQTISHYNIIEKLGEGGMGVVYKAQDTKLDRTVALKFLPQSLTPTEEDRRRFIREAKAAAALNHPNICTIHNIDEHEGRQFIVMEYVEGETLREIMDGGDLSPKTALVYGSKIANALAEAHEQDIIHRDIKPENIMVDTKGRLKVMDFGLAKLKQARDITKTGDTVGTLAYMSPEQIRGQQVDRRSDLFSLGILLYEMLTGQKPFRGEHEAAMTYAIVNEEPAPISRYLPEAPDELTHFFDQLLAKDPEERISSARKMVKALEVNQKETPSFARSTESISVADRTEGYKENEKTRSSTTISITLPGGSSWQIRLRRQSLLISVIGTLLVSFFLGWWFMVGGVSDKSAEAIAGADRPAAVDKSIAVLPFQVTGSGAEDWEDGMVTMLSLNLDGAAGLRAITDRTVFAKLEEQGFSEEDIGKQEALEIAREVGARYAIVGSAVELGEELRFGADILEASSGERLGQVEARGSRGQVTTLADELTRQVLGVLLERSEERVPTVNLESLMTESLSALKAYLEGERRFREGEYKAAVERFEAATEEDSTFALAYYRLYNSMVWGGIFEDFRSPLERAYEFSGQLPLREQRMIWASYTWNVRFRSLVARDSLRHFTKVYPEDPRMWNVLAEVLIHSQVPGGWVEAEEALEKAAELDPGVAQVHHHLVDIAMSLHRDSSLATERLAAHPEGDYRMTYQVAMDLVFGTSEERQKALASINIIPSSVPYFWINNALAHPTDKKLQSEVLKALRTQTDTETGDYKRYTGLLAMNRLERGQMEEAISLLQEENISRSRGACVLALSQGIGYQIPDVLQRSYLELEEIGEEWGTRSLLCAGISLYEEGRGKELGFLTDRLRERGQRAAGRDTARMQVVINELQGYQAWKSGDTEKAKRLWSTSKQPFWDWGAIWRGDLYQELGKLKKAEGWYLAAWRVPVAHERLGMLYEQMGKPEKAADAYSRFIEAWKDADPELQDRVEQAQRRLQELSVSEKSANEEGVKVE